MKSTCFYFFPDHKMVPTLKLTFWTPSDRLLPETQQSNSFFQPTWRKRPRAPPFNWYEILIRLTVHISRCFSEKNPASISHIWLYMILDDYTIIYLILILDYYTIMIIVLFRCPLHNIIVTCYPILITSLSDCCSIMGLLLDEHKTIYIHIHIHIHI